MEYNLINTTPKEETLCDKVTIDGFDYYVSNEQLKIGDNEIFGNTSLKYGWNWGFRKIQTEEELKQEFELIELTKGVREKNPSLMFKKVIATNNPNIDIPKVVDKVEKLAYEHDVKTFLSSEFNYDSFEAGYNKSQETHPFSVEDMIQFNEWYYNVFLDDVIGLNGKEKMDKYQHLKNKGITEEVIQIWIGQKPKEVYYVI